MATALTLPIEIWHTISLISPKIYRTMALTCRNFCANPDVAKRAFIRREGAGAHIEYRLPNLSLHSVDDQPAMEWNDGSLWWYRCGHLHRDNDLPAMTDNMYGSIWYQYGIRHRVGAPAVIRKDGTCSWYIGGNEIEQKI